MITGQLEEVNNATLEMTNRHKRENTDLRRNLDEMKDKLDDKASMIEKLEGKLFKNDARFLYHKRSFRKE